MQVSLMVISEGGFPIRNWRLELKAVCGDDCGRRPLEFGPLRLSLTCNHRLRGTLRYVVLAACSTDLRFGYT